MCDKLCSQWAFSNGTCCPDGTHRPGCEVVENKKLSALAERVTIEPYPFVRIFIVSAGIALIVARLFWIGAFQ